MQHYLLCFFATFRPDRELVLGAMAIIVVAVWTPSHYFFKWLRKKYKSESTYSFCILLCTLISILLIAFGVWLGNSNFGISHPDIRSMGATSGSETIEQNLMWFPFGLLALGVWAGFLSGYIKMPIDSTKSFIYKTDRRYPR